MRSRGLRLKGGVVVSHGTRPAPRTASGDAPGRDSTDPYPPAIEIELLTIWSEDKPRNSFRAFAMRTGRLLTAMSKASESN